jgi:hypothetical protein
MNIGPMLTELKEQRRALNRAIAALETLQCKPRGRGIASSKGRMATSTVEYREIKPMPRKNGTTGVLIPFLPGRKKR